ncbi:MAG: transglutaminase domain-containing protein [Chryseolinea sp.]
MKIFLTILCIVISCHSFAQKDPVKFGDIPMEDMKMSLYPSDSTASAVVLMDYGQSQLKYNQSTGFVLTFERNLRIKILKKDGLDWATISIPLYHDGGDDEEITLLKAATYNLENGKIVETKMKGDGTFKEKVNEYINNTKFTLPNVRQGSVIDVMYRVQSDFAFYLQDWDFQRTIPTRWSEYRTTIPEYYNYEKYLQGYIPMDIAETSAQTATITLTYAERSSNGRSPGQSGFDQVTYTENKNRWVAKNVPAFKPEPFMTTEKDYVSRMNFELAYLKFPNQSIKTYMGTWEDINKRYYESDHFSHEITANGFLKKIVEEITAGAATPEAKIAAINGFVRKNVEWDGHSVKVTDKSLKSVLEEKKGSSAEINLLLASMLEKAGFDVSGVLISTRDHGFVREQTPVSTQFNYVVCLVRLGDKRLLLDATDPYLATGVLPERCLNGKGLVISKTAHSWVSLTPTTRSRNVYNAELSINGEGDLMGKLKLDRSGYFASASRKSYNSKGEQEYVKQLTANRSWSLEKSEFVNAKDVSENFKELHEVKITDHLTNSTNIIYLNPFLALQEKENPFKSETRQYPVDFGSPLEKLYMCKFTIPDGYDVDELPKPLILKLGENSGKYVYNITRAGNTLNLLSQLMINNSLFTQEEYADLREFYNVIVAKQAEQIVLKKK